MPTIINLLAVGNGVSGSIFVIYMILHREFPPNLKFFALGKFLQTISWVIFISFSEDLTAVLMSSANLFLYFGLIFEIFGFTYFHFKNPKKSLLIFLIICFLWIVIYYCFSSDAIIRVLITSLLYFGLYVFMFQSMVFSKGVSKIQRIVGWLSLLFGIIFLARGVLVFYFNANLKIFDNSLIDVVAGYYYIILVFIFPIFLLLIAIEKDNKLLSELNATKDKFFSIIGHDLKNPFNAILGFTEILINDYDSYEDDDRKSMIKQIHQSSEITYSLLENLLLWSRSQNRTLTFMPEEIILSEVFQNNLSLVHSSAFSKKISTIIESKDKSLFIKADKNMLDTIIRNLLTNAIKFTPEGGEIKIKAIKEKEAILITISDTGVGMDAETVNGLFRIEHKISSKGTNNETGSGLGLVLCNEFIKMHNAQIWVNSEIGNGTTFYIKFPNEK